MPTLISRIHRDLTNPDDAPMQCIKCGYHIPQEHSDHYLCCSCRSNEQNEQQRAVKRTERNLIIGAIVAVALTLFILTLWILALLKYISS